MKAIVVCLSIALAGCGSFSLGRVIPPEGTTADRAQLDILVCKDEAYQAASTGEKQAEGFLLGLTIIGYPIAYEDDKATQRQAYADCMIARGYRYLPPT